MPLTDITNQLLILAIWILLSIIPLLWKVRPLKLSCGYCYAPGCVVDDRCLRTWIFRTCSLNLLHPDLAHFQMLQGVPWTLSRSDLDMSSQCPHAAGLTQSGEGSKKLFREKQLDLRSFLPHKLYENKINKNSHRKQESGAAPESTQHSLLRAPSSAHKADLSMQIILAWV